MSCLTARKKFGRPATSASHGRDRRLGTTQCTWMMRQRLLHVQNSDDADLCAEPPRLAASVVIIGLADAANMIAQDDGLTWNAMAAIGAAM